MERSVNMRQLALPIAIGLTATSVVAQTTPSVATETNRLPEVVITATRTAESPAATASSVTVITREQIEARQVHSLADALRGVPGMAVVTLGTPGQQTSVFTRGTESNHTLLIVDGRRVTSPINGGFFYENFTLDNVERIEVVRTPSSVLYGADAIGGVINVITRNGKGLTKPEHELSFEAGSFNTTKFTAASRGMIGKVNYSLGFSQQNNEFPRPNSDFQQSSVRGSLGYEPSEDWYFDLKGSYFHSDGGSPGSTAFPDPIATLERSAASISPGITWKFSETFESKAFYSYERQHQRYRDQFGTDNKLKLDSNQIEWQNDWKPIEKWTLTGGLSAQDLNVSQRNAANVENIHANQTGVGFFLQSQWSPFERLKLINSGRYDHYSDYEASWSWKQGVSYQIPAIETLIFANISESYSPPTPQDLYFPLFSNPNLVPEESRGWEAGLEKKFWHDRITVSATYFHNKIDNLIQAPAPLFIPFNVSKAKTEGVETGISFAPCAEFFTSVNYTYLTAQDTGNNVRLVRRPRHLIGWDLTVKPWKQLTLNTGLQYVMEREDVVFPSQVDSEDYLTVRAVATWHVTDKFEIWVRGENINDDQYAVVPNFPALRAAAYGGVRLKF
jgi:vitamin B12 transporter